MKTLLSITMKIQMADNVWKDTSDAGLNQVLERIEQMNINDKILAIVVDVIAGTELQDFLCIRVE